MISSSAVFPACSPIPLILHLTDVLRRLIASIREVLLLPCRCRSSSGAGTPSILPTAGRLTLRPGLAFPSSVP